MSKGSLLLISALITIVKCSFDDQESFSVPATSSLSWAEASQQTVQFSTTLNSWNLPLHQHLPNGTILDAVDILASQTNGEGRSNIINTLSEPWTVQTYSLDLD